MRQLWWKFAGAAMIAALLPCSSAGAASAAAAERLAYVGTDHNIYACDGDCRKPRCITCPRPTTEAATRGAEPVALWPLQQAGADTDFEWPTYSPDGRKLAYVAAQDNPRNPSYGIYVYDFGKKISTRLFQSSRERGIYLYWLPDGRRLSFLVTEPDQRLSLMVAEARQDAVVRIVATGLPLYYDWNRAGNELLIHSNVIGSGSRREDVSLMSLTPVSQDVKKVLARGYSPFKTPCWSPDGTRLAYVATSNDIAHLYVADSDANNPKEMAKLMVGESSFVWAPDSRHIAFSTSQLPPHAVMDGISVLDVANGSIRKLVDDEVAAFYFSPDSRRIAYVAVPPRRPYYSWWVADLGTGSKRKLGSFLTTGEESITWRYFEQLSLSHSVWAPDSSAILFAGVLFKKEPRKLPPEPRHAPAPDIFVLPIDGSAAQSVAEGVVGFWSPAPLK